MMIFLLIVHCIFNILYKKKYNYIFDIDLSNLILLALAKAISFFKAYLNINI